MIYGIDDEERMHRNWMVTLLIVVALATTATRISRVTAKDGRTPFLSANDRSRWAGAAALVETGSFEIETIAKRKGWDTIDKVAHIGKDGKAHFYSSKPPILSVLLAGIVWCVQTVSGTTLAANPFYVGRISIAIVNLTLLLIFFVAMRRLTEAWCTNESSRLFVMAAATFGTLVTPFGVTINNHLPAVAAVAVSFWALLEIWYEDDVRPHMFLLAGGAAAIAAACELPALGYLVSVIVVLFLASPTRALGLAIPAVSVVAAMFFVPNYVAHDSLRPPYAHRAEGEDYQGDNWYNYPNSYWLDGNRKGVDEGEDNISDYLVNVVIGHHGILSLTPIWFFGIWGVGLFVFERKQWAIALAIVGMTAMCLIFYVFLRPPIDRNYGGVCCGLRWMLWLVPLWLTSLIPAVDYFVASRVGRISLGLALAVSIFSATYPAMNPWTHPWIYQYWQTLGWL
jgi:hypothetical protein